MSNSNIRVRFAPSPTGYLHVGGARTALYNWLLARQMQGVFVLRVEDTDLQRSTEESVEGILEGMRFLGLTWDEGPIFQSDRLDIYREYAQQLLDTGRAYECFCTPEELDQMRKELAAQKLDPKYDGRCRHLTEEQKEAYRQQGRKSVIRFKHKEEGKTEVRDLTHGTVVFDNSQLDDFVIIKSDGMPTYNFAVVIDDATMDITHVIRGEDHLSNTPKQIQIYEALGFQVPEFAHIPMILGPDKARLSKRHGATSVTQFRDEGYLPEAMLNYLALLGWGYDDSQTVFSVDELIEKFSLERVSKNPAVFDIKKLEWLNVLYIRELTIEQLYELTLPYLQKEGLVGTSLSEQEINRVKAILKELQPRIKLLSEIVEASYYFFTDELKYNEKAVNKILRKEQVPAILEYLLDGFAKVSDRFNQANLEPIFVQAQEKFSAKLGDIIQPVRVAVTGTNISPGIYEVLELLVMKLLRTDLRKRLR